MRKPLAFLLKKKILLGVCGRANLGGKEFREGNDYRIIFPDGAMVKSEVK